VIVLPNICKTVHGWHHLLKHDILCGLVEVKTITVQSSPEL